MKMKSRNDICRNQINKAKRKLTPYTNIYPAQWEGLYLGQKTEGIL
jgi:hypothetical protein